MIESFTIQYLLKNLKITSAIRNSSLPKKRKAGFEVANFPYPTYTGLSSLIYCLFNYNPKHTALSVITNFLKPVYLPNGS